VTGQQQARRRDSAATREALLDAAVELFAERGYDRTTVRDIAGRAGVNQALLFRYFGSKEALFAAVVARAGRDKLAESPPEELFARILRAVLEAGHAEHPDNAMRIMLRSGGEDAAASEIRRELTEDYVRVFAGLTDSPDGDLRAQLVLAWIVGIDLVRSVSGTAPLADSDAERIVACVLPAVQTLLQRVRDVSSE
jgi:AcrR family transcriptional regulator